MSHIRTLSINWWNSLSSEQKQQICKNNNTIPEEVITGFRIEVLYRAEQNKNSAQIGTPTESSGITDFLNHLNRLPIGAKMELKSKTTKESSKTRDGSYYTLKCGLSTTVYFIGKNLQTDKLIVEVVG